MADRIAELKNVPLFSGLSQRQLRRLAASIREREIRDGTTIVREGEMSGIDFFVIAEGEASVSVAGSEVARLGPGDYFGELALIGERVRTATVTAVGHLRCLAIAAWDFRRFVKENPDVSWKLLQHLARLLTEEPATGQSARR